MVERKVEGVVTIEVKVEEAVGMGEEIAETTRLMVGHQLQLGTNLRSFSKFSRK